MFMVNVKKCLSIFDRVYVSSDSDEMLSMAQRAGAIPIKRGLELCGETPNIPVYQHAFEHMDEVDCIVAVQANSPTVTAKLISDASEMMAMGYDEVMTCHPDYSIYGSIWALSRDRLLNYGDPYKPHPKALIVDDSVDIHTEQDYKKALCQLMSR